MQNYDPTIKVKGLGGVTENYNKSDFSRKTKIFENFQNFINDIDANYIFMSYNSDSILSKDELKTIFLEKGNTVCFNIDYAQYRSNTRKEVKRITEYLFFIDMTSEKRNFKDENVER